MSNNTQLIFAKPFNAIIPTLAQQFVKMHRDQIIPGSALVSDIETVIEGPSNPHYETAWLDVKAFAVLKGPRGYQWRLAEDYRGVWKYPADEVGDLCGMHGVGPIKEDDISWEIGLDDLAA